MDDSKPSELSSAFRPFDIDGSYPGSRRPDMAETNQFIEARLFPLNQGFHPSVLDVTNPPF